MNSNPVQFYQGQIILINEIGWAKIEVIRWQEGRQIGAFARIYKTGDLCEICDAKDCQPSLIGIRVFKAVKHHKPHWEWLYIRKAPKWFDTLPAAIAYAKRVASNRKFIQVKVCATSANDEILTIKTVKI